MDFKKVYNCTKDLNILYVEDDLHFREDTSETFSKLFNKVHTAVDGKDGLQSYLEYYNTNNKYYDIVITDINMPFMNGIELTKEIYKQNKEQAIVVISAYNDSEYLMELVNIGIEQFLVKPLTTENVFGILYNISSKIVEASPIIEHNKIIKLEENLFWDTENILLFTKNDDIQNNIKLTKNENILMQLFIQNGSKLSTTEEIFNSIWKDEAYLASTESLNQIISRFRRKVPSLTIQSLYGLGYKLIF